MESMKDFEKELEESYKLLDQDYIEASDNEADEVWISLKEKMQNKESFDVKIKEAVKGGVVCFVEEQRAFLPASQLSEEYVEKLEDWVGKHVQVRITELNQEEKKIILSARVLLKEKKEAEKQDAMAKLHPGQICEGTVDSIQSYGAFVELENGLSALIHISQMAERRIASPREVVKEGQKVTVKILKIQDGKISLTLKGLDKEDEEEIEEEIEKYVEKEEATTSLGSLFAGIHLDA